MVQHTATDYTMADQ